MVAGKVEELAQRSSKDEKQKPSEEWTLSIGGVHCPQTRRKDYRSKRQLRVAVLKGSQESV